MQSIKMIYKRCSALMKLTLVMCCIAVVCMSALGALTAATKMVSIKDGSNSFTLHTLCSEPETILAQAGVVLNKDDEYDFSGFEKGSARLTVKRAFDVVVSGFGENKKITVTGGTVADAIRLSGLSVGEEDVVSHSAAAKLTKDMVIEVADVSVTTSEKMEEIPFDTRTAYSGSLTEGTTKLTEGQVGYKKITYQQTMVDGVIVETKVVEEKVVKQAVAAVKTVGTKKPQPVGSGLTYLTTSRKFVSSLKPKTDFELDSKGVPKNYKKVIKGNASAYCDGSYTATGKKVRTGYVAVNTKQIPYGTKLYIKSSDGSYFYGYASAEDTGGFVNWGTRVIDLYFNTRAECLRFGVRSVEIYVL